jgi:hypothetical protein
MKRIKCDDVMELKDCSEYHLRQILGASQIMRQRYKAGSNDDISKSKCVFCTAARNLEAREDISPCMGCPWYMFEEESCSEYGIRHKEKRIVELTDWIELIEAEMQRRGLS